MKTIFYNPVFINPQAYHVFPSLYYPQKPDDSTTEIIETAIYCGKLEVIVNTGELQYQINKNNIKFTISGNCVFTINQITQDGSTVLGRFQVQTNVIPQHPNMIGRYSAKGKTNTSVDKNILADLSGNNNDLIVKNIVWDSTIGSGYGGYIIPTSSMIIDSTYAHVDENNQNKIVINNFKDFTDYIKIPVTEAGQLIRINVSGINNGMTLQIGLYSPYPIIKDGSYTYQVQYDDVAGDMSDSDGYIHINHYSNISIGDPTGEVVVEFLPEYPDCLVIPKLASMECSNLSLTNDFTIIAQMKYTNGDEYIENDCNFITFSGEQNLIDIKYSYSLEIIQKVLLGTQNNTLNLSTTEDKFIITPSKLNTKLLNGKDSIQVGLKNKCVIGGETCRIEFGNMAIYNKTLTDNEIQNEIKRYNLL